VVSRLQDGRFQIAVDSLGFRGGTGAAGTAPHNY
jgi:hypothetical protein